VFFDKRWLGREAFIAVPGKQFNSCLQIIATVHLQYNLANQSPMFRFDASQDIDLALFCINL